MPDANFPQLEFTTAPNNRAYRKVLRVAGAMVPVFLGLLIAALGWSGDWDSTSRPFLIVLGVIGVVVFSGLALRARVTYRRVLNPRGPNLILNKDGLFFGGIKLQWWTIREAILCTAFGVTCIGIRTQNDEVLAPKFVEHLRRQIPAEGIVALRRAQARTNCALVLPPMREVTPRDLCETIERYHSAFKERPPRANTDQE